VSAANWERTLAFTLGEEGGFVNDSRDPGGATNLGVTLRTWEDWTGRPASVDDIRALTEADVAPLYHARYWNAVKGDDLPSGVDLICFDTAVNCGPRRAVRWLQDAAGVMADGIFGPATLRAVRDTDRDELIDHVSQDRRLHYQASPNFPTFGRGWIARLSRVTTLAHQWAS